MSAEFQDLAAHRRWGKKSWMGRQVGGFGYGWSAELLLVQVCRAGMVRDGGF